MYKSLNKDPLNEFFFSPPTYNYLHLIAEISPNIIKVLGIATRVQRCIIGRDGRLSQVVYLIQNVIQNIWMGSGQIVQLAGIGVNVKQTGLLHGLTNRGHRGISVTTDVILIPEVPG